MENKETTFVVAHNTNRKTQQSKQYESSYQATTRSHSVQLVRLLSVANMLSTDTTLPSYSILLFLHYHPQACFLASITGNGIASARSTSFT